MVRPYFYIIKWSSWHFEAFNWNWFLLWFLMLLLFFFNFFFLWKFIVFFLFSLNFFFILLWWSRYSNTVWWTASNLLFFWFWIFTTFVFFTCWFLLRCWLSFRSKFTWCFIAAWVLVWLAFKHLEILFKKFIRFLISNSSQLIQNYTISIISLQEACEEYLFIVMKSDLYRVIKDHCIFCFAYMFNISEINFESGTFSAKEYNWVVKVWMEIDAFVWNKDTSLKKDFELNCTFKFF